MPNHCENHLFAVSTDSDEHKRYRDLVFQEENGDTDECILSFNRVFPIPESPEEFVEQIKTKQLHLNKSYAFTMNMNGNGTQPDAKRFFSDEDYLLNYLLQLLKIDKMPLWYTWNNMVLGTKSGAYDFYLHQNNIPFITEYKFCTAWTPPYYGLLNLRKCFPNTCFYLMYSESNMELNGFVRITDDGINHSVGSDNLGVFGSSLEKRLFEYSKPIN